MPNLYEDAVMRQLESIGQPITRKSTTVADLGGEGLDISTLLMLLFMSGIFGGGGNQPMLGETGLPGGRFQPQGLPQVGGALPQAQPTLGGPSFGGNPTTPLPPSRNMSGVGAGAVPSLENIDIMSLINMFSKIR